MDDASSSGCLFGIQCHMWGSTVRIEAWRSLSLWLSVHVNLSSSYIHSFIYYLSPVFRSVKVRVLFCYVIVHLSICHSGLLGSDRTAALQKWCWWLHWSWALKIRIFTPNLSRNTLACVNILSAFLVAVTQGFKVAKKLNYNGSKADHGLPTEITKKYCM